MIDSAVTRFGLWAESKLHEHDDKYQPRWTPEQIFMEPAETKTTTISPEEEVSAWLDSLGGSF